MRVRLPGGREATPRIHGELLNLGFEVSVPTVSRYLQRLKRQPDQSKVQRWGAFLQNHREVIAAFDFFTVPTLSFGVLYCFFVIEHQRRRILHLPCLLWPICPLHQLQTKLVEKLLRTSGFYCRKLA